MDNILIRNLSQKDQDMIEQLKKITHEKTASKAMIQAGYRLLKALEKQEELLVRSRDYYELLEACEVQIKSNAMVKHSKKLLKELVAIGTDKHRR